MKYNVYIWSDPKTYIPVYVGMGSEHRPFNHLQPKASSPLALLLKQRKQEGFESVPNIVLNTDNKQEAFNLEMKLIKQYGREDLGLGTLLNLTDGGPGSLNLSPIKRALTNSKLKNTLAKPEVKKTRSKASKEVCLRPEVIAKRVATTKIHGQTEEGKAMAKARTLASWATRKARGSNV